MTTLSTHRILIVDDNPQIHTDFAKVFGKPKHSTAQLDAFRADVLGQVILPHERVEPLEVELAFASQGEEGIRMALEADAEGRPFYMAFVDVRMPPNMDGVQTVSQLWKHFPDLQCVLCTAYSDYDWAKTLQKLGRSSNLLILKKPFESVEVLQMALALAEKTKLTRRVTNILQGLEQRVLERTIQAEAANRAKSEFLANMSHELRSPMTAILGYTDILIADPETPRTPQETMHLETIRRNGEHLLEIINDILDLSKIEAGKMVVQQVPCSPLRVVSDVVGLMQVRADEKGLPVHVEVEEPIPTQILSDVVRLRQILINLLGNAIKFTDAGTIQVRLSCPNYGAEDAMLRIDVIDSGIGMTDEQIKRLFQPFVQVDSSATRRFGGTGLGLTISHRMARLLEGEIEVESWPGEGSVFRLLLACGQKEVIPAPTPALPTTANKFSGEQGKVSPTCLKNISILLAEDGLDNQRLITALLRKAGADVSLVENGKLCVEAAWEASHQGKPFDFILTDMQMPVMDGYEAVRRLRSEGYGGKIIALTANAMSGDRQRCLNAGCDDYASKPINKFDLVATLARNHHTPIAITGEAAPALESACR